MDDVQAFELNADISSDRDMNLVRGLETQLGLRTEILNPPPPLQASHLDREVVTARHSQLPGRKETGDGESGDDNHTGCDGASHNERYPSLPARIESDG